LFFGWLPWYIEEKNCSGREGSMKKHVGIVVLVAFLSSLSLALMPEGAGAATKKEINASVDVALKRFAADVKGAGEFLKAAKGTLVMPRVKKAGFILGGEYGNGALRVGAKTVAYYNMAAGSAGLQIGAEEFNLILCFMDEAALKKFRASKGWQAGVDGTITLVTLGAGGSVDTTKLKEPIVGFVFGQEGLMAGVSLQGLKFTKTNPE
jgi:lipid-binding SYLF domain-containing protein